jgi:hypothetical protein
MCIFPLNRHCRICKSNSVLTSYTIHPNKHILKFSSLLTQRVDVQTTPRTDVPASPRLLLPHRTTTHTTHRRNLEHYLKPYPKSFTCLPDSPAAIHTPNRLAATANIPVKDFELPRRLAAFHAGVNKELCKSVCRSFGRYKGFVWCGSSKQAFMCPFPCKSLSRESTGRGFVAGKGRGVGGEGMKVLGN